MKKVLFISPYIFQNNAISVRIAGLSNELSSKVDLHYLTFNFGNTKAEPPISSIIFLELPLILKPLLLETKRSIFNKIFYKILLQFSSPDYYVFTINHLSKQIIILDNEHHFRKIVLFISPFSFYMVVRRLPTNIRAKLILDIGDPYSNNAVWQHNMFRRRRMKLELSAIQGAAKSIVTNNMTRDFFLNLGIPRNKLEIISQGIDKRYVSQYQKRKYLLSDINLIYAGNFYKNLRDPTALIKAVTRVRIHSRERVSLTIYTNSKMQLEKEERNNLRIFGTVNNEELMAIYHNHNMLVFIDNAFGIQTSGKFWELLPLGIPLLFIYSNPESDLLRIATQYSHVFPTLNCQADIEKVISNLFDKEVYFERILDEHTVTWENQAENYFRIIIEY